MLILTGQMWQLKSATGSKGAPGVHEQYLKQFLREK
jgi:hypothetical protein